MTMSVLRCSEPTCGLAVDRDLGPTVCPRCHGLLEFTYGLSSAAAAGWPALWARRLLAPLPPDRSGVWRFRELLPDFGAAPPVTMGEGGTPMPEAPNTARWVDIRQLALKHQGANPTGSFKDLGMTICMSEAVRLGATVVACASTGNTSSSMAAYAARAGLKSVVLVPREAVSRAKLAQARDFGALVLEAGASFDQAFRVLRELAPEFGLYLVNSINPFRIEGQKTALLEILERRQWRAPDFLALPGGNLGNASAMGKGLSELSALGILDHMPRLIVVQAQGASPFHRLWQARASHLVPEPDPSTRATAIRIGSPANWPKALRAMEMTDGLTVTVSDQEIAEAKATLARDGIGCEPASAASVAGLRQLRRTGAIDGDADVVAILTGHQLKDTDYILERPNPLPESVDTSPAAVRSALATWLRAKSDFL